MPLHHFSHNADHGVVVCRLCSTCLIARKESWIIHLRASPHRSTGEELRLIVDHLSTYTGLRSFDELRQRAIDLRCQAQPCRSIDGLEIYDGYTCICADGECHFQTRRLRTMREHMHVHAKKAKQHSEATPLWRACQLQTYFTAKGMIDYFEVDASALPTAPLDPPSLTCTCTSASTSTPTTTPTSTPTMTSTPTTTEDGRAAIFEDVKGEIEAVFEPARRAQDPLRGNARADREPWLVNTGFGAHLDGLLDAEIRSSYALPSSVDADLVLDDAPEDASNSDLQRILVAAEHTLRDAYRLCSDTSARYKLTQQRAIALSQFRLGDASEEPNSRGSYLRRFKNERTLVNYFRLTKQLLTYYYRVVYRRDGHFTSRAELDEQLKKAIRELLVSLMSCPVGRPPFQSALLSFCAMGSG